MLAKWSFLPSHPDQELSHLFVCPQPLDRVVVSAKVLLGRDELVNCPMAVSAKIDRFVHLLPSELLLEPFVAVAGARNQMVLGRATLGDSTAEITAFFVVDHQLCQRQAVCINARDLVGSYFEEKKLGFSNTKDSRSFNGQALRGRHDYAAAPTRYLFSGTRWCPLFARWTR